MGSSLDGQVGGGEGGGLPESSPGSWPARQGASEYTEHSFAHICETGGARRSRLRGLGNVFKRYLMYVAARNLAVMMRALFNMGTPKSQQAEGKGFPVRRLGVDDADG